MRELISFDTVMISFISAIGYGMGYFVPLKAGLSVLPSILICYAAGMLMDMLAGKIVYSRAVQKSRFRKYLVCAAFILFFLLCQVISERVFGSEIYSSLGSCLLYSLGFAVLGYCLRRLREFLLKKWIRKNYRGNTDSYQFGEKQIQYIEKLNHDNAEITGSYDRKKAVKTENGIFVGEKYSRIYTFYGIPYAKAPVGELRFRAPQKPDPSEKVFEAKYPGPSAIQLDYAGNPLRYHRQSEDCLYLNVFADLKHKDRKEPVIVYFHGGDFACGGSANPVWDGSEWIAAHPETVFVSFNYRLGLFGFIGLSGLPGGESYGGSENLGILDQIAALRWVRENIAAFGGDPEDITVMGDGAGGTSILLLSVCEKAKGLFRKAIVLSGSMQSVLQGSSFSDELGRKLLSETGCSSVEELCKLSEERLKKANTDLEDALSVPVCDGKLLPQNPEEALSQGAGGDISFILGLSENETGSYRLTTGTPAVEDYFTFAAEYLVSSLEGEKKEQAQRWIGEKAKETGKKEADRLFMELFAGKYSLLETLRNLSACGKPVYLMDWEAKSVIQGAKTGGTDCAAAVLGNHLAAAAYGNVLEKDVTEVLQVLLMKFIRGEKPELYHHEIPEIGEIKWEPYPKMLAVTERRITCEDSESVMKEAEELFGSAVPETQEKAQ